MYDHVGLSVEDLERSVRFYTAALAALGIELSSRDASSASFVSVGGPALYLSRATAASCSAVHVALRAADQSAVKRFYQQGLEHGGRDHGAPGLRKDYSPTYYGAFLLDPDGNNIEAVHTG